MPAISPEGSHSRNREYFKARDGEKGPIEVRATMLDVATERENRTCAQEKLVVIETLDPTFRTSQT
jgi:hypothetical protein